MIDSDLQNSLRNQYSPDGSNRRKIQMCILDILIECDRIFRLNNVQYWLDSGTLIGAVRHGGFIPWDDDIDICINRKDLKKLREVLIKNLPPYYKYVDHSVDPSYDLCWPRVIDSRYLVNRNKGGHSDLSSQEMWIDIFPMEHGIVSSRNIVQKTFGKCLRQKWNIVQEGTLKKCIGVILFPFASVGVGLLRIWNRLVHGDKFIHVYCSAFSSIRDTSDIYPLDKDILFEGHLFKAPNNIDNYLRKIYGDYMKLPPENKRENHNFISFDSK